MIFENVIELNRFWIAMQIRWKIDLRNVCAIEMRSKTIEWPEVFISFVKYAHAYLIRKMTTKFTCIAWCGTHFVYGMESAIQAIPPNERNII